VKIENFFTELKRRNVYKVAVAYVVVAWLIIQAASIFLPAFDAPPWVIKAFIIIIGLCFPVALVLSWAFEITPEGIKLESEPMFDPLRNDPRFQKLCEDKPK
jgi:adenylate cyclase